ncbi:MAG TPA: SDR family NAD(P)-dependent oxidoreductase [Streptosporangiaceae bacterium]|nr:SDR family NAD(P)-dependent oxidoreductase [Streptosporangiaceae bacterium]
MKPVELAGAVVLVTGGANGIGAACVRRLAGEGAHVVVADVDEQQGMEIAAEVGGVFRHCDVTSKADHEAAVAAAVSSFGGLDVAVLNAGVATVGVRPGGPEWDLSAYRRAFAVNVDGVFFGVDAVLPALRARGRGALVFTASLAGLTSVPADPIYAATKHAVVGLARALGPALAPDNIAVNAMCPGFADTSIVDGFREIVSAAGIPLLSADNVAQALLAILASDGTGEAWYVQPGRPPEPFRFRNIPGPRATDGSPVGGVPEMPDEPGQVPQ